MIGTLFFGEKNVRRVRDSKGQAGKSRNLSAFTDTSYLPKTHDFLERIEL